MIMHASDLNKLFDRNGYVLVPGVLTPDEVLGLRRLLEEVFARSASGPDYVPRRMLFPSDVLRIREIYSISLRSAVVRALKDLLGPSYTMFPDFHVQRNMFGYGERKGWHTDAGSEGRADYLFLPTYRFVKCGVYLQDNTKHWGGGIDVICGGHKFPLSTANKMIDFSVKRLSNRVGEFFGGETINIKAGDLVVFDSRLPHTSTWPRQLGKAHIVNHQIHNLPQERNKLVFYWNACRDEHMQNFLSHSERRAENEEIKVGAAELFFSDYLRLTYPQSYPSEFVQEAMSQGVQVASLDEQKAKQWEEKYQRAKLSRH